MKPLIHKVTAAISGAVLFAAAIAMAGLGFAVIASLAIFAFFTLGIALLASPFVRMTQQKDDFVGETKVTA
ncbi:MAG: hypothetical protein AAFQ64_06765 [Pseudomonadota bacterium]